MKTILTLLLSICVSISYADTLKIAIQDNPVTQREVYNDIKQFITQLAESLSTTSEYLFSILTRQAVVHGAIGLILEILVFIGTGIWISKCLKFYAWAKKLDKEETYGDNDLGYFLFYASGFIIALLFITAICNMQDTLTKVINPEYWALREILDFIKHNSYLH